MSYTGKNFKKCRDAHPAGLSACYAKDECDEDLGSCYQFKAQRSWGENIQCEFMIDCGWYGRCSREEI